VEREHFSEGERSSSEREDKMLRKRVTLRVAEEGEIQLPRECLKGLGLDAGSRGMVQVFQQRMLLVPLLEVPEVRREIAAFAEEMETGVTALDRLLSGMPRRLGGGSEDGTEEGAEVRAALECILHDDLRPAIRKLREAAGGIGTDEAEG
jgi:hypothetical protein